MRTLIASDVLPIPRYWVHVDWMTAKFETLAEARAWARSELVPYKVCGIRDCWTGKTVEEWAHSRLPPPDREK